MEAFLAEGVLEQKRQERLSGCSAKVGAVARDR